MEPFPRMEGLIDSNNYNLRVRQKPKTFEDCFKNFVQSFKTNEISKSKSNTISIPKRKLKKKTQNCVKSKKKTEKVAKSKRTTTKGTTTKKKKFSLESNHSLNCSNTWTDSTINDFDIDLSDTEIESLRQSMPDFEDIYEEIKDDFDFIFDQLLNDLNE